MTNKNYTITITTTSLESKIDTTAIQVSAKNREQAITKLFDNHLRYQDSVDIEEVLQNNNTITINLK